jgi:hypothetical protein
VVQQQLQQRRVTRQASALRPFRARHRQPDAVQAPAQRGLPGRLVQGGDQRHDPRLGRRLATGGRMQQQQVGDHAPQSVGRPGGLGADLLLLGGRKPHPQQLQGGGHAGQRIAQVMHQERDLLRGDGKRRGDDHDGSGICGVAWGGSACSGKYMR